MKQDLDSLYYDRERLIEENEILAEQIQNFNYSAIIEKLNSTQSHVPSDDP